MTGKDTGLKALVKLTRAQFGSIVHDPDTKYIVTDGETVREYLGDIPIGGGGGGSPILSGASRPLTTGTVGAYPFIAGEAVRSYDETKIAVVLLDGNDKPTGNVTYFETIADSSTYLKDNAANRYLVHIGELTGISTIGNGAYNSCTALRSIDLPDSITGFGYGAFYATSLAEITIPNSVTSMSEQPFANCTSLTRVVLSNSVTTIPQNCFSGCTLLSSIVIPDSVTQIYNFAFNNCTSLTNISIPSSVRAIGPYGFYRCTNMSTITIDKPEGSISGAPWGADNAAVIWTG